MRRLTPSWSLPARWLLFAGVLSACHPFRGRAWRVDDTGRPDKLSLDITWPQDDEVFAEDEALTVRALLSHPTEAPEALELAVIADGTQLANPVLTVTATGTVTWTTTVTAGLTSIELVARDTSGSEASDSLTWRGNRAPEADILAPQEGATLPPGNPVGLAAEVFDADYDDGFVDSLPTVRWYLDGELLDEQQPGAGGVTGLSAEGVAEGDHEAVLEADDGVVVVEASVRFRVRE